MWRLAKKIGKIVIGLGLIILSVPVAFIPGPGGMIVFLGGFIILMAEIPFVRRIGLAATRNYILPLLDKLLKSTRIPPGSRRHRVLGFFKKLIQKRVVDRFSGKDDT